MTRKLILLNLVLLTLLGLAGWRFRQQYLQMKAHEVAVLGRKMQSVPPPAVATLPKPEKLVATTYLAVADQNLFSKDRNPNEIPDPKPLPPPPPPVPAFPAARGVMLWDGEPPTVLLSERPGGTQKGYHPGDRIGPWKILAVTNQYVTFEWEGQQFKKRIDELLDKVATLEAPAPPVAVNTPAASQTQSLAETKNGMGRDVGGGIRAASCTDGVAVGTVRDGYVRTASQSPMGDTCYWQKK